MLRALTPLRLAVAGALLLVVAFVLLLTTHTNSFLLVPDEAHPLAELVQVPGARDDDDGGGIYYVDVVQRKASLLERLFPSLRDDGAQLVSHDEIAPPGVDERQRIEADRLDMQLSQQVATAVALRALGYKVRIEQKGVRVAFTYSDSGAAGKLDTGDVITAVDGARVRTITQLRAAISRHAVGEVAHVSYVRDGKRRSADIGLTRDVATRRPVLGIFPQVAVKLRVPFRITFNLRNVGGPSAGLAFALQILEERGRDVDHGHRVAATGVIEPDGSVGPIGCVRQKIFGVRQAHVDTFLVPAGDNYRQAKKYAGGVRVIPVKTFQQALHALATLPAKD